MNNNKHKMFKNLKKMFFDLFFNPVILLKLSKGSWFRPFRIVMLLCVISGILMTTVKIPGYLKTADEWGGWLEENIESLSIENGKISWEKPKELPCKISFKGIMFELNKPNASFSKDKIDCAERMGIWIKSSQIFWWVKSGTKNSREKTVVEILSSDGKFFNIFDIKDVFPGGNMIKPGQFKETARSFCLQLLPGLFFQKILSTLFYVLFYLILFALFQYIFKNSLFKDYSFSQILSFDLYAAFIPIIMASIYNIASSNNHFIDYPTAFMLAFFGYIIYASRSIQKTLPLPDEK
ncbi:MAG: DUF1189 family protein [Verrucomicrobiota bacterium]|nr:DUF1189 family protein [Verrucomicrobiota bacterium]